LVIMKSRFYTSENIQKKAKSIKTKAESYCPNNDIRFRPGRSALLVIDMQKIFLEEKYSSFIPSAPAIISLIRQLIEKFSEMKRPVFFTRHINTEDNAGMMSRWWKSIIVEENKSSQIIGELAYSKNIVIKKPQYDAFVESDLESFLTDNNVTQLVICGVMTHLCCETTARSAFMKGFEVFFTVDGTATYNEQLHRGAIINLAHGFAKPALINEIITEMDSFNAAE